MRRWLTAALVIVALILVGVRFEHWWSQRQAQRRQISRLALTPDGQQLLQVFAPVDGQSLVRRVDLFTGYVYDSGFVPPVYRYHLDSRQLQLRRADTLVLADMVMEEGQPDQVRVQALDATSGLPLWQALHPGRMGAPVVLVEAPHALVLATTPSESSSALTGLNPATGEELWSLELATRQISAPALHGQLMLLLVDQEFLLVDTDTGRAEPLGPSLTGPALPVDQGWLLRDSQGQLVRVGPDGERLVLGPAPEAGALALHGETLVHLTANDEDRWWTRLRASTLAGEQRWVLDLPAGWAKRELFYPHERGAPDASPWPVLRARYLPLVLTQAEPERDRLAIVDLEQGKLSWLSEPVAPDTLDTWKQLQHGTTTCWLSPSPRGELILCLDGDSGRLSAALPQAEEPLEFLDLLPGELQDGFLVDGTDAHAWVLSLPELEPVWTSDGVRVEPGWDAAQQLLGPLPAPSR